MADRFRIFVRSVRRDPPNVFDTICSMVTRDPVGFARHVKQLHVVSGDGNAAFLQPLERTRFVQVHHAGPETYRKIALWKPKRRAAWSYLYSVVLAHAHDHPIVLMEDDVQMANGWAGRLADRVTEARLMANNKPFALSAYYGFGRCPFRESTLPQRCEPCPTDTLFWGNLCTYWPREALGSLINHFRQVVTNSEDMSTDLTVQAFLRQQGGMLFYTIPSLVQHVGDKTTLRDDGVRRSPIYRDFYEDSDDV